VKNLDYSMTHQDELQNLKSSYTKIFDRTSVGSKEEMLDQKDKNQ